MLEIKASPIYKNRIHPIVDLLEIHQEPGSINYIQRNKDKYIIPLLEISKIITIGTKYLECKEKFDIMANTANTCIDSIIKTINNKIDLLIEKHPWFDEIVLVYDKYIQIYDFIDAKNRRIEYCFITQIGIMLFEY